MISQVVNIPVCIIRLGVFAFPTTIIEPYINQYLIEILDLSVYQVVQKQRNVLDIDSEKSGSNVTKRNANLHSKAFSSGSVNHLLTYQKYNNNNRAGKGSLGSAVHFNFANIQTKLKVSQPDDIYEQEADRVADQVMMQMSPSEPLTTATTTDEEEKVNRKCKSCEDEEEEEEKMVQRKTNNTTDGYQIPKDVIRSIDNMGEGTGLPLDVSTRSFMESRFGFDFSKVRIHTDEKAAKSSQAVNALAFTTGNNIVFGKGQHTPTTEKGKRLIAHELTHVVQQSKGERKIQRAPKLEHAPVFPRSGKDSRQFILETIEYFNKYAKYLANDRFPIDRSRFDGLHNAWYMTIVNSDSKIDEQEPVLKAQLRSAYIAALRILMTRAAKAFHMDERDLYHQNIGRIPMWAWQVPHHMEPGISTPIPAGRSANPTTGEVNFMVNGFNVTIAPDIFNVPELGHRARTTFDFDLRAIHQIPVTIYQGPNPNDPEIIIAFTPPIPRVLIHTSYGNMVRPTSISEYGRGTTPEDIAGGWVTPESTSLRFHEGTHGLNDIEFLENNPPPQFTGKTGDTRKKFEVAMEQLRKDWDTKMNTYINRLTDFQARRTHCVGTTIDQYNVRTKPKGQVVIECP
jgi:hypothetical protein